MTYKDTDKQREANAERQRRYKAKQKALLSEGVTGGDEALPERTGVDLEALGIAAVPNGHGGHKLVAPIPKRGKDIKTFADLPPEVRRIIEVMSTIGGKIDQAAKDRRTAIAIHYQTTCFGPQGM